MSASGLVGTPLSRIIARAHNHPAGIRSDMDACRVIGVIPVRAETFFP